MSGTLVPLLSMTVALALVVPVPVPVPVPVLPVLMVRVPRLIRVFAWWLMVSSDASALALALSS